MAQSKTIWVILEIQDDTTYVLQAYDTPEQAEAGVEHYKKQYDWEYEIETARLYESKKKEVNND